MKDQPLFDFLIVVKIVILPGAIVLCFFGGECDF